MLNLNKKKYIFILKYEINVIESILFKFFIHVDKLLQNTFYILKQIICKLFVFLENYCFS